MNTYKIYKAIKSRLAAVAPGFYYLGQYLKKSDNSSYIVPAIYIEMPKLLDVKFEAGQVQVAKEVTVKIHLVTNAPHRTGETVYQDNDIQDHQAKLDALDKLMTGCVLRDDKERLLTQQFVPTGGDNMNFEGVKIFSVITYTTDLYSYHLK